jgi:hypothetical protein
MPANERDPVTTRARTDRAPREPVPLGEGLTELDQDIAGTMASEGGRSAQAVEAPLSIPDASAWRRRRRALFAAAALGAAAGVLLVVGGGRPRTGSRLSPTRRVT